MHQAIHRHPIAVYAISLGLMTVFVSLLQPIPSAYAQQLTRPVSQETGGADDTQGRRIENMATVLRYPMKSLEKKDAQTSTHKAHRLIRRPQNLPIAPVEPFPSDSSPVSSVPTPPLSLQTDNTTSQSKEPSSLHRSVGAAVPLAPMSVTPSAAAATGSTATSTAPTGTIPLAAAGAGSTSPSGSGGAGGRTLRGISAEMPELTQLISSPAALALSVNPTLGVGPLSLAFTAQQGGASPAAQTLTISNNGDSALRWGVSHDAPWMWHTPGTGTGTGTVTIGVIPGSLPAGTYSGQVTLWPTGALAVTVPVTFTVSAAAPVSPVIGMSPTSLFFTAQQGGPNPAPQTVAITNKGGGTLTWSVSNSNNTPWIAPSLPSGTGNGVAAITVTTGALTAGTYNGLVSLSAPGALAVTVPVTFTVSAAAPVSPVIGMSPTSLFFTAQQGGPNPAPQTVAITNKGGGTLTWSVSNSNNTPWIAPSPLSGTGNGVAVITVTTGALTAGTYNGLVSLSAPGALAVTVPVTFTVSAAPTISLSQSTLSYAATQGAANPVNQNISLTNTGGTLNWTINDDASWLVVSPASGSGSRTLTASVNTAGLTAKTYNGTLTVSAGTSSKTVAVKLTVNAPATSSATLTWNANTESDLAGYKVYRKNTASGAYGPPIMVLQGNVTTYIATGLQIGTTYYFVVTAYDLSGNESPLANEVSKSIY